MILIRPLPCRCGGRVHPIIDRHWRRRRGWWFTIALRLALVAVIVLVLLGVVVALVGRRAALLRRKRMGVFPVELQHFDQEGAVLAQAADGERAAAPKGPTCRPDGVIVRLLVLVPPFLLDFALRRKPFSRLRFGQRVDPDPLVPIIILSTTAQVALLIARVRRVALRQKAAFAAFAACVAAFAAYFAAVAAFGRRLRLLRRRRLPSKLSFLRSFQLKFLSLLRNDEESAEVKRMREGGGEGGLPEIGAAVP